MMASEFEQEIQNDVAYKGRVSGKGTHMGLWGEFQLWHSCLPRGYIEPQGRCSLIFNPGLFYMRGTKVNADSNSGSSLRILQPREGHDRYQKPLDLASGDLC